MFQKLLVPILLSFSLPLFAQTLIPIEAGDKAVHIDGFHGNVILKAVSGAKKIRLTISKRLDKKMADFAEDAADNWSVAWKKSDGKISITISPTQEKGDWKKYMQKGGLPQYDITIKGPSLPVNLVWRKGKVIVDQWKGSVSLKTLNTELVINKGEGSLELIQQDGKVKVVDHVGSKVIETFRGQVDLKNTKGNIKLTNFSGKTQLQGGEGQIDLVTHSGSGVFSQFDGKIDFENDRSHLRFEKHKGDIHGKSGQGDVSVNVAGETNVRIRSEEGKVVVRAPGSGAHVNVGSKSGSIDLPSYFKLTRYATIKVSRGRLRGGKKGNIFVRTESGAVSIR